MPHSRVGLNSMLLYQIVVPFHQPTPNDLTIPTAHQAQQELET